MPLLRELFADTLISDEEGVTLRGDSLLPPMPDDMLKVQDAHKNPNLIFDPQKRRWVKKDSPAGKDVAAKAKDDADAVQPAKKEKPAPKEKPAKADPAKVKDALAAAMKGDGDPKALAESLMGLTVAQIQGIRKELGLAGSGTKAALAKKMAESALARVKAKGGPPAASGGQSVFDTIKAGMGGLPPEKQKEYGEAMDRVTRHMPAAAMERIAKSLKKATFHPDTKAIAVAAIDANLKRTHWTEAERAELQAMKTAAEKGEFTPGGCFAGGELHVDGDYQYSEAMGGGYSTGDRALAHEVYAHEMTHAIDGDDNAISKSPEWLDAWGGEIRHGGPDAMSGKKAPLSEYGGESPSEGFAEFGRLLYGSPAPLDQIEGDFPKASALFKSLGLWPEGKQAEGRGEMPELFGQRLAMGGASHVDTVKGGGEYKGAAAKPQPDYEPVPADADDDTRKIINAANRARMMRADGVSDDQIRADRFAGPGFARAFGGPG